MLQQIPNPDVVKESVGKLEQFVAYLVEVLRSKNWTRKLLLFGVVLFLVCNPVSLGRILELFNVKGLPNQYHIYFWLVVCGIFIAAVVVAWFEWPKEKTRHDLVKRSAIKGLLPYGKEDAELFAQLERGQDVNDCTQAIAANDFRFGVLCGESGNGKTSFLQAGVWPRLFELNHRCVYVKCTELDPLEAIRLALLEQLSPADRSGFPQSLPEMLETAAYFGSPPLVLILDQFEQFFVHRPRKRDRAQFLSGMENWFKRQSALPVKILLCLRNDFLDRLIELQKLLGYSLGPHQNFRLERFTPAQAAEVFNVIAAREKLDCDSGFVEKMAADELAGRDDGLVSPVDIQVLAWMIVGQNAEEERAFNERTFRKLGGVEGLLERFLNRALDARETDSRRQAAVKTLLALTDLDRNARAGALTTAELEEKLRDHLRTGEVAEAIKWASRGDVRLIAPMKRKAARGNEAETYELAHERLIPALRRIAGKQLGDAARAEQLLDRRTNEWLGSIRRSRYLFSWSELRLINRHRQLINWGRERQAKEALLAASQRRFHFLYGAMGLAILLAFIGWTGWHSNKSQTWLIKRDLRNYGSSLRDEKALKAVAQAFVYAGDPQQTAELLNRIVDNLSKARALKDIADTYAKLGEKETATGVLGDAVKTAGLISNDDLRVYALREIAESYAKLGEKEKASALLADATKTAELISDDDKPLALSAIAESYAKIAVTMKDSAPLAQAVKTAGLIGDADRRLSALTAIAESHAKLGEKEKAGAVLADAVKTAGLISDDGRASELSAIAESYAKLGEKERASALLADAVRTAALISDDEAKLSEMSFIAESYAKLAVPMKDSALLADAVKTEGLITEDPYKGSALLAIAQSYAKFAETMQDSAPLAEAVRTVGLISGIDRRVSALRAIAESYAKLGETLKDSALLADAVKTVGLITDDEAKASAPGAFGEARASALSTIGESYAKLGEKERAHAVLADAVKIAGPISNDYLRALALSKIVKSYAKIAEMSNDQSLYHQGFRLIEGLATDDNRDKVLNSILSTKLAIEDVGRLRGLTSSYSEVGKASALARILTAVSHPELIGQEKEAPDDDEESASR